MRCLQYAGIAGFVPCLFILDLHGGTTHFYLDAGTGSIVLQAVIGALVGGLLAIKLFWNQIKAFFAKLFRRETQHADEPEAGE